MFLEIKGLKKGFGSGDSWTEVLRGIDFSVEKGEFCVLLGPSGSGKSTLLNIIAGLLEPTSGEVIVDGHKVEGTGVDRGVVFQQYALFPWLTVKKNVQFGLKLQGKSQAEMDDIAEKYIKMVGLEKFIDSYPKELSGGMKQRVMIAIALVGSPSIVIADEPTTSLDVTIEAQILDVLKNLQKTLGTSIILITHDLGVIAKLCDRVLVMYGGKIVERGSVDEIFYDTAHPYTKGLMHSIAKLDTAKGHKLQPIEGTPPDLFAPPKGCPFAARCEYCMEICKDMPPQTYELSKEHETCCWLQHEYAPDTDMRRKVTEKGEV